MYADIVDKISLSPINGSFLRTWQYQGDVAPKSNLGSGL